MTDEDVIAKVQSLLGGVFRTEARPAGRKTLYRWRLGEQKQLYALCAAIYPFLGQRRQARMEEFFQNFATPQARKKTAPHKRPGMSAVLKAQYAAGLRTTQRDPKTGRILGSRLKEKAA